MKKIIGITVICLLLHARAGTRRSSRPGPGARPGSAPGGVRAETSGGANDKLDFGLYMMPWTKTRTESAKEEWLHQV